MYIDDIKIIKENLLCNTLTDLAWAIANFYRNDNSEWKRYLNDLALFQPVYCVYLALPSLSMYIIKCSQISL